MKDIWSEIETFVLFWVANLAIPFPPLIVEPTPCLV